MKFPIAIGMKIANGKLFAIFVLLPSIFKTAVSLSGVEGRQVANLQIEIIL
jgi:hypothetical protein